MTLASAASHLNPKDHTHHAGRASNSMKRFTPPLICRKSKSRDTWRFVQQICGFFGKREVADQPANALCRAQRRVADGIAAKWISSAVWKSACSQRHGIRRWICDLIDIDPVRRDWRPGRTARCMGETYSQLPPHTSVELPSHGKVHALSAFFWAALVIAFPQKHWLRPRQLEPSLNGLTQTRTCHPRLPHN